MGWDDEESQGVSVMNEQIKCAWYPRICNFQCGHSGKYCNYDGYCEYKRRMKNIFNNFYKSKIAKEYYKKAKLFEEADFR